jgi:iron complex transport system substrate-binding protein
MKELLGKITASILFVALVLPLAGCSQKTSVPEKPEPIAVQESDTISGNKSHARTITDLGGNTVILPPVEEIKRVVIISPPTTSVLLGVIPDTDMIVGVNARAFTTANAEIISKLFPNWSNVETAFVNQGFVTNTEELLNLHPDIVFYYGAAQKGGIEKFEIPIVDFMMPGENNAETVTIAWDNLMRQIFDVNGKASLESEWKNSNQKAQNVLGTYNGEKKTALFLFSNTGGSITVYGSKTYADTWFEKSGLINVAAEVTGQAEVSMEQLYLWDPDLIYVFIGSTASMMRCNQIQGQDWSLLTAYKNETIYDIPQAVYSWGAPCSDSPLMPLWLISKSYPQIMSEDEFSSLLKDYYDRMYNIDLDNQLVDTVLSPRKALK